MTSGSPMAPFPSPLIPIKPWAASEALSSIQRTFCQQSQVMWEVQPGVGWHSLPWLSWEWVCFLHLQVPCWIPHSLCTCIPSSGSCLDILFCSLPFLWHCFRTARASHFFLDQFVTLVKKRFQIQNDLVLESVLIDQPGSKYQIVRFKALCVLWSWCHNSTVKECSCVFEVLSGCLGDSPPLSVLFHCWQGWTDLM